MILIQKIIGLFVFIGTIVLLGFGKSIILLLDIPSILWLIGSTIGLTLLNGTESLKQNFIIAGWLGFLLGFILMLSGHQEPNSFEIESFLGVIQIALIAPFYGHVFAIIVPPFVKKTA